MPKKVKIEEPNTLKFTDFSVFLDRISLFSKTNKFLDINLNFTDHTPFLEFTGHVRSHQKY